MLLEIFIPVTQSQINVVTCACLKKRTCLPFRIILLGLQNSFRIMTTHPICDDPGATDERGPGEGHMRSREVTIRFSLIAPDRMKIERARGAERLGSSRRFQRYAH